MIHRPTCNTLLPYTTLFRSTRRLTPPVRHHSFVARHPLAIVRSSGEYSGGSARPVDRKSTRLNSSHVRISYAVFCLKKKKKYSKTITITFTTLDYTTVCYVP